jgi:predicted transcriptional regulator YdeE
MERRYGPLTIVGIELRTTNQDGQSFQDIPPFWQKFFEEGVANTIPHKASEDVFAVYTNFAHESVDNEGVFSLVIGCPVHEVKHLPGELTAIEIPSSKYKIFNSELGKPEKIVEVWQQIWQLSQEDSVFDQGRSYLADFERYQPSGEIDIYIGINDA